MTKHSTSLNLKQGCSVCAEAAGDGRYQAWNGRPGQRATDAWWRNDRKQGPLRARSSNTAGALIADGKKFPKHPDYCSLGPPSISADTFR